MTRTALLLMLGYVALSAATVFGLFEARCRVLATLSTGDSQAAWDAWHAETVRLSQSVDDPMKRRETKAPQPPLLILLRDHFPAALVASLVAATLFYWFLAFLIRGSMNTPAAHGAGGEAGGAA